jgi:hypothetical protein
MNNEANKNLQEVAAQLANNSDVNTETGECAEVVTDVATFHCAVNFVPKGDNVLVRIKELGKDSLTMKMSKAIFGDKAPSQHENFTAEIDMAAVYQSGSYLQGGNAKMVARDGGGTAPFDMRGYMANLKKPVEPVEDAFAAEDDGAPFETE